MKRIFFRTTSLCWGIMLLASGPLSAEVLDKMPPVNHMNATMLFAAMISGIFIYAAFRFRLWLGAAALLLLAALNYLLPDDDPMVRTAALDEAGRMFTVVFYSRWLLLLAGCIAGLKTHRQNMKPEIKAEN